MSEDAYAVYCCSFGAKDYWAQSYRLIPMALCQRDLGWSEIPFRTDEHGDMSG